MSSRFIELFLVHDCRRSVSASASVANNLKNKYIFLHSQTLKCRANNDLVVGSAKRKSTKQTGAESNTSIFAQSGSRAHHMHAALELIYATQSNK